MHDISPATLLQPGDVLSDRYEVVRFLGAGAMGWVVEVVDTTFEDQRLALKLLYPHLLSNPISVSRFRNEVLISRKLSHPHIIQTFNYGEIPERGSYLTMEFVDGPTLRSLIDSESLPVSVRVELLFEILDGLAYAHDRGIIHRDLKPDNILLTADHQVKIGDFGLAQALRQESTVTRVGSLLGTPFYMPPEAFRSETFDIRSDIYSFGVLMFELLAQRRPFADTSVYQLARLHCEEEFPYHLLAATEGLPAWSEAIVRRCCAKHPRDRFQNVHELRRELPIERSYVTARPPEMQAEQTLIRIPELAAHRKVITLFFASFWTIIFAVMVVFCRTNVSVNWRSCAVLLLIERGIDVPIQPLRSAMACEFGNAGPRELFSFERRVSWPTLLVAKEPSPRDAFGRTPLHRAVVPNPTVILSFAEPRTVQRFLEFGANPDAQDADGNSSLHYAVGQQSPTIASMLLDYRADVNLKNRLGETVLYQATMFGHSEIVRLLLQRKADVRTATTAGVTPLHQAARLLNLQIARKLLSAGASVDAVDAQGRTPLLYAVPAAGPEEQRLAMVELLLLHGSLATHRDSYGKTALEYARSVDSAKLVAVLNR